MANSVVGAFQSMMARGAGAIRAGVGAVMGAVGSVRSAVVGFFAGTAGWLVAAGRNVISGFVSGIRSMAGAARSAASSVVGAVRNLLPFSPAKEGPLSGRGSPDIAGAKMIEMLADGIRSQAPALHRAMAGAVDLDGLAAMAGAGGTHSGGRVAQVPTPAGRTAPVVIELRDSGGRFERVMLEALRHMIRVEGGDPVAVLRAR